MDRTIKLREYAVTGETRPGHSRAVVVEVGHNARLRAYMLRVTPITRHDGFSFAPLVNGGRSEEIAPAPRYSVKALSRAADAALRMDLTSMAEAAALAYFGPGAKVSA